ncbi:MAG: hypothetical protein V1873_02085 [Verrucomicrobiota bacterium]
MKMLSWLVGVLGVLVILAAVYGRFHGPPSVILAGYSFAARSVLLAGNSILLVGLWLGLVDLQTKK